MSSRYFAKVVSVQDAFTVVINAGRDKEVRAGRKFIIVGLGEEILDPDTNDVLERLEIVRGSAQVTHVQDRIATLKSIDYEKKPDERQIKKVTASGALAALTGTQDTVTETTKPGEMVIRGFKDVRTGDFVIAF